VPKESLIQIKAYAFRRGEEDYWPAIAIFSVDENGNEIQHAYAEPNFGSGRRPPRFKTAHEALEEAKRINSPHFDNGRPLVEYRGVVCPVSKL